MIWEGCGASMHTPSEGQAAQLSSHGVLRTFWVAH